MPTLDTPLFVKTHDFLLWLIQHTQRFPKYLRHSYTHKLETLAFEFQEAILMANTVRGAARSEWLSTADGKLVCLRALLRLAYDLQLLAGTQIGSSNAACATDSTFQRRRSIANFACIFIVASAASRCRTKSVGSTTSWKSPFRSRNQRWCRGRKGDAARFQI